MLACLNRIVFYPFAPLSVAATLFLLTACGSAPKAPRQAQPPVQQEPSPDYRPPGQTIENVLYDHYQQWKGTPYRYGGTSRRGVDCSGFVYRAYRDGFGRRLPRTTAQQSRQGIRIDRRELRSGDLVFFRTGASKQHVGIYLDNGLFMHASTSIGVTISRLNNRYWRKNYWQSRRVAF